MKLIQNKLAFLLALAVMTPSVLPAMEQVPLKSDDELEQKQTETRPARSESQQREADYYANEVGIEGINDVLKSDVLENVPLYDADDSSTENDVLLPKQEIKEEKKSLLQRSKEALQDVKNAVQRKVTSQPPIKFESNEENGVQDYAGAKNKKEAVSSRLPKFVQSGLDKLKNKKDNSALQNAKKQYEELGEQDYFVGQNKHDNGLTESQKKAFMLPKDKQTQTKKDNHQSAKTENKTYGTIEQQGNGQPHISLRDQKNYTQDKQTISESEALLKDKKNEDPHYIAVFGDLLKNKKATREDYEAAVQTIQNLHQEEKLKTENSKVQTQPVSQPVPASQPAPVIDQNLKPTKNQKRVSWSEQVDQAEQEKLALQLDEIAKKNAQQQQPVQNQAPMQDHKTIAFYELQHALDDIDFLNFPKASELFKGLIAQGYSVKDILKNIAGLRVAKGMSIITALNAIENVVNDQGVEFAESTLFKKYGLSDKVNNGLLLKLR